MRLTFHDKRFLLQSLIRLESDQPREGRGIRKVKEEMGRERTRREKKSQVFIAYIKIILYQSVEYE